MSTPQPVFDMDDDETSSKGSVEPVEESPSSEVEETDEGGAIVKVNEQEEVEVEDSENFYRNLINEVDEEALTDICVDLYTKISRDIDDRTERDKIYEEGLRRTGLGQDAPGGATFEGASRAVHPMVTKAVVEYSSRTIKELFPADGPVKTKIWGKITQDRLDKADRKKNYMNWQCTKQMPELKYVIEQGLTQQGISGVFYLRLVYDDAKRRAVPLPIYTDEIILPSAATSFYTADRVTYRELITEIEYESRVKEGYYVNADLAAPSMVPDSTKAQTANDKIEGKTVDPYNQDGLRLIWEVKTFLTIEDDPELEPDRLYPYLLTIDYTTKEPLRLVRNWDIDDPTYQPLDWIIEFPFVPWRGSQPVGFIHLIGSLAASATGTLRALLDSGHINNLPTLLKLKGSNFSGQSLELQATGVTEIEGAVATDDIRKLIMAVPFNPPSQALFQLLGFIVSEGADVVKVTMDTLSDQNVNQMPVGTTLALIEQGLKVLAAIHSRQHAAFARFLSVLHRVNRMYLTDTEVLDETGELLCYRADFEGPEDITPVSDPEIFSDAQRYAQMQLVEQRAAANPQLYDQRKVELMILRRTRIPDAEDLLVAAPKMDEMNPVNENVALTLGRPVMAYPDQDHLAHIQVLLDYLQSPFLGSLPIIAPTFIPGALNHLKEHITYWYVSYMEKAASASVGGKITSLMEYKDPETREEMDKLLATISASPEGGIKAASQQAFGQLPPIIQQAQKLLQSMSNPAAAIQNTPQVAAANIKAQSDAQDRQVKQQIATQQLQDKAADRQARMQETVMQEQAESQRSERNLTAEAAAIDAEQSNRLRETQITQLHEDSRNTEDNEAKERINAADNATAQSIAAAEIEAGKHSNVSTGTGIGRHESNP